MFNWIKIIKLYSILSDDISELVLIDASSFFLVKEDQQEKATDLTALHTLRSTQCKKKQKQSLDRIWNNVGRALGSSPQHSACNL